MYIEYYHESEVLKETLEGLPDLQVEVRNLATGPETPLRAICSVSGSDCDEFVTHATSDSTVDELKLLEEGDLRRLYWVKAVPGTVDQRAYEIAVDAGGVYLQSRRANGGWCTTMNYPDQASFQEFQRRITEEGMKIEPTVVRVGRYLLSGGAFDLTDKQEIVLTAAIEGGYFDIPREITLGEIADRLSISEQAASERLRRAMDALGRAAVTSTAEENQIFDN